jgi:hypothetical protein
MKSFPWVGIYLRTVGQQNEGMILLAFFIMMGVFYIIYVISFIIWDIFLFPKSLPQRLNENFYG